LHNLGLRALSNVVDATNLILLEWGHPIHGFDLARLGGSKVVVRRASEGEKMATLDGVERTFTADDLLICDGDGPVAIAGVMGGLDTERGVDPEAIPRVLASAAALMAELGGGVAATTAIDRVATAYEPKTIRLRPARAAQLLGTPVSKDESLRILEALGCRIVEQSDDAITAEAPSWRPDLEREVDLIEEVARVRGYEQIPTAVPRVHPSETGTAGLLKFVDALRDTAVAAGLYEAVNYGFLSIDDLRKARVSTHAVPLANPLSEERSVMRTSLLPGLTAAATRAQRHGATEVRLFELARTFHPSDDVLPREDTVLAIALAGQRPGWIGGERSFDLYDGKGVIQAIVDGVFGQTPELAPGEVPSFLHPKRSAVVTLTARPIGFVGEMHPDVGEDLGLIGRVIYAELDVSGLHALSEELGPTQARGLPKFPAVARDIAMLVRDQFTAGEIAEALREASSGLAESVRLFDLYRGGQIPDGHRSLAFRVTYRDPQGTLTDKRVDKVHASLARLAGDRFEATIR